MLVQSKDGNVFVRDFNPISHEISHEKRVKLEFSVNTNQIDINKFYVINYHDLAVIQFSNPNTIHNLKAFYNDTLALEQSIDCSDNFRAQLNEYLLEVICGFN